MAADRDLGVAFVKAWSARTPGPRRGWEMLAATGVRGLRLSEETGAFASFEFTEANPGAFRVLEKNLGGRPGLLARCVDARAPRDDGPFDYIDLDPYGSPVPFVPSALARVAAGGVLAVTATDMMVLAGVQPGACERRYGARPVRGRLGPEGGLRILLAYLTRVALERGRAVRPLLAYTRDHYVRAYLEVDSSIRPPEAKVGVLDPTSWEGPPLPGRDPYGPLWLGPLGDPEVVDRLEVPSTAERPRETGRFLSSLREEIRVDAPFYYEANTLARRLGLPRPPALSALVEGLRSSGWRASRTHARREGVRTEAPRAVVEATVRALVPP